MLRFIRLTLVLGVLAGASGGMLAQSLCPGQGLTLGTSGGRLGDLFSLSLTGAPNAAGLLAIDSSGGPVGTPLGLICIGFTPDVQILPVQLDAAGTFALFTVAPTIPSLNGVTGYFQAGVVDAAQPGGIAISNGAAVTLFAPRVYFINNGASAGPFGGGVPGGVSALNVLTDIVAFSFPLPASVVDAAYIPGPRWLAFLLGDGTLAAYDANTGLPTLTMPAPGFPSRIRSTADGSGILLMSMGTPPNPFSTGTPGSVRVVSTAGQILSTVLLGSGNPSEMLVVPDTTIAYLRLATGVIPVDYGLGFAYPPISLGTTAGSIVDWRLSGALLYCLHGDSPRGSSAVHLRFRLASASSTRRATSRSCRDHRSCRSASPPTSSGSAPGRLVLRSTSSRRIPARSSSTRSSRSRRRGRSRFRRAPRRWSSRRLERSG